MIEETVPREAVTRDTAEDLGKLCGIRPFYSRPLMRLERSAAAELCKTAVREHPRDREDRGLYIRWHAIRGGK